MTEGSDPYLYPGTDVLRNIPGIRSSGQLIAFETLHTGARIYELRLTPIPGGFNTAHLNAIHKHIFQDVYSWAGHFRTTMLAREHYVGGPVTYFTLPQRRARNTPVNWLGVLEAAGDGAILAGHLSSTFRPAFPSFCHPLRTVLAVKGSLRRAQQRRALDGSGPFCITPPDKRERAILNGSFAGNHFAAKMAPFFAAINSMNLFGIRQECKTSLDQCGTPISLRNAQPIAVLRYRGACRRSRIPLNFLR